MTAVTTPLAEAVPPDDAYASFWHEMEDDVGVTDFDADDTDIERDADDVYFAFVSSVEA